MSQYLVLITLIFGCFIIGMVLFFLFRVLFKKEIEDNITHSLSKSGYIQAGLIVVGILILYWFVELGHKWAALLFALVIFVSHIVTFIYLKKK